MQEPAGEFGEVVRGTEGTVMMRVIDGDTTWLTVEWDAGVVVDVDEWMTDTI
jgi:hypothetical protein